MTPATIAALDKWQTLIGSALGPFLAIILSLIAFLIKSAYDSRAEKKESVRLLEVSITRSINDLYSTRKKLEAFSQRLRALATEARAITDDRTYFLERINYPAVREIFFNEDLANHKIGSTYLHNQIMFIDAGLKETNVGLHQMGKDFEGMLSRNDTLMNFSPRPTPQNQRTTYIENLQLFATAIDEFVLSIKKGIKTATQIKTYNLKLLKNRMSAIRTYEGTRFKCFKNKQEKNEYKKWSNVIERINTQIEVEVETSITEAESGYTALQ